jgi:hypothetical protein
VGCTVAPLVVSASRPRCEAATGTSRTRPWPIQPSMAGIVTLPRWAHLHQSTRPGDLVDATAFSVATPCSPGPRSCHGRCSSATCAGAQTQAQSGACGPVVTRPCGAESMLPNEFWLSVSDTSRSAGWPTWQAKVWSSNICHADYARIRSSHHFGLLKSYQSTRRA